MITQDEVKKVAKLAKLKLTDHELTYYQGQLEKIVGYIQNLETLDAQLDPELFAELPERKDQIIPSLPSEELLKCAPDKVGSAIRVPRILE